MATEIGIIKALVGTATATATDGTIRNLQVGDKVYQNDLITTGAAGAVEIEFADGSTMDMGRSSQAMLDLEVFDPSTATTETAETTETTDDIAAIQQALLEGEDPTVAGEATAAGAGAGGGSEGGHDFVVREYLNPEVTPDNGFDTIGVSNEFDNSEELNLILVDEEEPVVEPPVNEPPSVNPPTDPENPPPTGGNDGPSNIVSAGSVNEAGLSFGSTPTADSEFHIGSFVIADPDGLDDIVSISINGTVIAVAELGPSVAPIDTTNGVITITAYDADSGELSYQYELTDNFEHEFGEGANTEFFAEVIPIIVTDSIGQTGTGNITIDIVDDIPVAQQQVEPVVGAVQEDALEGVGNAENAEQTTTAFITAEALAGLVNAGADAPVAISLNAELTGATGLTQNDVAINWSYNAETQVLEGVVDGTDTVVFTLAANEGDDDFTFTLLGNIDHDDDNDLTTAPLDGDAAVENLSLAGAFIATDTDGDSVVIDNNVSVNIENDVPVAIVPQPATLINAAGLVPSIPLDIDGDIHDNIGADQTATLRFTVQDGAEVIGSFAGGEPEQLNSGGLPIYYYNGGDILYGSTTAPEVWDSENPTGLIFQVSLNLDPNGPDSYDFQLFSEIDAQLEDFSVSDPGLYKITGGNSNFIFFDTLDNSINPDILITPLDVDASLNTTIDGTINTNNNVLGANNPSVASGEGIRVNFVSGISGTVVNGGNYAESTPNHSFEAHETINGASATFVNIKGSQNSPDLASVKFIAFNETGDPTLSEPDAINTSSDIIDATRIVILDAADNQYIFNYSVNSITLAGYTVTFNQDGSVDVTGITEGTQVALFTESGYNAIEYVHLGAADFAVGDFGGVTPGEEEVITFDTFPLELVDADGDAVTIEPGIEITLVPDNAAAVVSDAALENGIPNNGESNTDSGSFSVAAFAGANLTLIAPPNGELTSNKEPVEWTLTDNGKTLTGAVDGNDVIVITIANNGDYEVTLSGPLDHPIINQEDQLNFVVNILATLPDEDDVNLSLTVFVNDDKPEVEPFQEETVAVAGELVEGNIFDYADDGDILPDTGFGFGADGGFVHTVSIGGMSFNYDGETISVAGSNDAVTGYMSDGNELTVTTFKGETITVNMDNGDYSYVTNGEIGGTLPNNVAPEVNVTEKGGLLGLVGVEALNLIDLSQNQQFNASDVNNNIHTVEIVYDPVIDVGLDLFETDDIRTWEFSQALAEELGLVVSLESNQIQLDIGVLGLSLISIDVTDFLKLTITSQDGGPIDNAKLNEFLGTVYLTGDLLDVSLLDSISISATDTGDDGIAGNGDDLSDSASFNELINADVELLSSPNDLIIEGNEDDNTIDRSSSSSGERIYGLDGNDNIIAGSGNDLIRGGVGDDTIDGGAGNDIIIGGIGNDNLTGGSGNDVFRIENGHAGTVGTPAVDTITDFSIAALAAGGDVLDLADLLQGEARVGDLSLNLTEFMSFEYDGSDTTLSISSNGSDVDQLIVFEGVNFFDLGDTDLEIINSLLQSGQLLVDEAQAGETYQGGYADVDFVVTDNDGDTDNTTVRFDHDGIEFEGEGNVAPEVDVDGDGLLGLLGVSALGAIDFGTNQTFKAFDRDNNITRVDINFSAVLGVLGGFTLTYSEEAAAAFGLNITATDGSGLSLLGNAVSLADFSSLVITSEDGGNIDNFELNAFLATVQIRDAGNQLLDINDLSAGVLDAVTIKATDAFGLTDTETLARLAEVEAEPQVSASINVVAEADVDDVISAELEADASLVLGGADDETLIGSNQNDVLFGGEGDDTLIGGQGNDILIGGEDADLFEWREGDDNTDGEPAVDFVVDFNANEGDELNVADLLTEAGDDLTDYLTAEYDETADQTTIKVFTDGTANDAEPTPTQTIIVNGQLDQASMDNLLNTGSTNVD